MFNIIFLFCIHKIDFYIYPLCSQISHYSSQI
jgi:hypothetical protein